MALIPPAAAGDLAGAAAEIARHTPDLATSAATNTAQPVVTVANGNEDVQTGLGEKILDALGAIFDWLPFG